MIFSAMQLVLHSIQVKHQRYMYWLKMDSDE